MGRNTYRTVWAIETPLLPAPEELDEALRQVLGSIAKLDGTLGRPALKWENMVMFEDGIRGKWLVVRFNQHVFWSRQFKAVWFQGGQRRVTIEGKKCGLCKRADHSILDCTKNVGLLFRPLSSL